MGVLSVDWDDLDVTTQGPGHAWVLGSCSLALEGEEKRKMRFTLILRQVAVEKTPSISSSDSQRWVIEHDHTSLVPLRGCER
eukprot:CAMPEP_0180290748 /NCGR_PEP_ID=MMETSP0988-20121125/15657_1 /TAXON_ID=697907 /ORGANISM="non described non described, Strain CCMP2293" /LENGTH=81 /DNA_ID=CAMNT_0022266333 /DNA_START=1 /DNA_END=246 /DNA_ORIENTATION=-